MGPSAVVPLLVTAAVGSVASGFMAHKAAEDQSDALQEQGRLQLAEAQRESERILDENKRFAARQKLAFLKNGVTLTGSPSLVTARTLTSGQEEAEAVRLRGVSQKKLSRAQADATRGRGRAALISGLGQSALLGSQAAEFDEG